MATKTLLILSLIGGFFLPIVPLFIIIGMAVLFDTITGIIKSRHLNVKILSSRLFQGIVLKTFIYMFTIMLFYIAEHFVINEIIGYTYIITRLVTLLFTGVELYSVDENIREFNRDKGFRYYFILMIKTAKDYLQKLKDFKDTYDILGNKKK